MQMKLYYVCWIADSDKFYEYILQPTITIHNLGPLVYILLCHVVNKQYPTQQNNTTYNNLLQ